jgi:septum formation protein
MNKIILASASPRRKELMLDAGYEFEVRVPDVDETPLKKETPAKMVKRLSELKAHTIAAQVMEASGLGEKSNQYRILAADTTVVSPTGKNLGKPESLAEARKMIGFIQGKTHTVLTGYTIVRVINGKIKKAVSRVVMTRVTIKKMSKMQIDAYLNRGESMDKAGAYAAQGFGRVLIEKIQGSYTNVVGLPMVEVEKDLGSV